MTTPDDDYVSVPPARVFCVPTRYVYAGKGEPLSGETNVTRLRRTVILGVVSFGAALFLSAWIVSLIMVSGCNPKLEAFKAESTGNNVATSQPVSMDTAAILAKLTAAIEVNSQIVTSLSLKLAEINYNRTTNYEADLWPMRIMMISIFVTPILNAWHASRVAEKSAIKHGYVEGRKERVAEIVANGVELKQ